MRKYLMTAVLAALIGTMAAGSADARGYWHGGHYWHAGYGHPYWHGPVVVGAGFYPAYYPAPYYPPMVAPVPVVAPVGLSLGFSIR